MAASLYEKYGGFASISRVVMAFYDRLLDSDQVGPYFDHVDMKRLIDHQTKFVASLLGGPAEFAEERLAQAHKDLNISDADFDAMKQIFDQTLADHGFSEADRAAVVGEIEARRAVITAAG